MKMIWRAVALSLVSVLIANVSAFGWGAVGHMAVAPVAYQRLTPTTKARVDALLKLNPDLSKMDFPDPPRCSSRRSGM